MSDEHYTPKAVYEVVKSWVVKQYHLENKNLVRPFWPGANYKEYNYQPNDVVIDNPPFSIQQAIVDWYLDRGITFFLFFDGKGLSLLAKQRAVTYVIVNQKNRYDNSNIRVKTNFLTSLEPDNFIHTAPDLSKAITSVSNPNKQKGLSSYVYPSNVLRFSELDRICSNGYEYVIPRDQGKFIRSLDEQEPIHKQIYGGGMLVSDLVKPTPEMVQKVDFIWHLSESERKFIQKRKEDK